MKRDIYWQSALVCILNGAELRNPVPDSRPEASVNLMTEDGAASSRRSGATAIPRSSKSISLDRARMASPPASP